MCVCALLHGCLAFKSVTLEIGWVQILLNFTVTVKLWIGCFFWPVSETLALGRGAEIKRFVWIGKQCTFVGNAGLGWDQSFWPSCWSHSDACHKKLSYNPSIILFFNLFF